MNFLENLQILMDYKKISKSDLSRIAGVTPASVNAWFNGKYENVSVSTAIKIAKYFCITVEELISGNLKSITFTLGDFSIAELHSIIRYSEFLIEERNARCIDEQENDN